MCKASPAPTGVIRHLNVYFWFQLSVTSEPSVGGVGGRKAKGKFKLEALNVKSKGKSRVEKPKTVK